MGTSWLRPLLLHQQISDCVFNVDLFWRHTLRRTLPTSMACTIITLPRSLLGRVYFSCRGWLQLRASCLLYYNTTNIRLLKSLLHNTTMTYRENIRLDKNGEEGRMTGKRTRGRKSLQLMSNICEGYKTAKKRAEDRCLRCVSVMRVIDVLLQQNTREEEEE